MLILTISLGAIPLLEAPHNEFGSVKVMRFVRRIGLLFTALIVILSAVGTTAGTAFAAGFGPAPTTDLSASPNFYMIWDGGQLGGLPMWQDYPDSESVVYAPTADNPYNWYSCYIADCDGLVADATGVHLLSIEKGYGNIATGHDILWGSYAYTYTAANGDTLSFNGSWNGRQTLPWTTQFYSADKGQWLTLTLSFANLNLYWQGQPQIPDCNLQSENAVPFCTME